MLYFDRVISLLPMSGVAIWSAFDIMLLEHLIASIFNSNLAVIPRVQFRLFYLGDCDKVS